MTTMAAVVSSSLSIPRLRRLLLWVLTLSTLAFTAGVYVLVQRIFENFGPGVEQDLIWKAVRGAEELAHAADLGLAVKDTKIVAQTFGQYRQSDDVLGIAAVAESGALIASAGELPEPLPQLFSGPPGVERRTPGYVVAWAPAMIEGSPVGKVAMIVKTRRLVEARALLRRMSLGTAAAGLVVWILGVLFVNFFTRSIVERDNQLAGYASGLEKKVAERTADLDRANEGMRLVLDNVQQGFVTVSLDGVMADERSTVVDRWFGAPPGDRKFSTMIRPFDHNAAAWFDVGCDGLRDGFMPPAVVLEQFPRQLGVGNRTLRLSYIGIGQGISADETPQRLLIVMSDVTDELARERVERDAREMTRAFQQITADRVGFEQFFAEANNIVRRLLAGAATLEVEKRLIHTLKGNCSIFGIDSVAESCHALETRLADEKRRATELERAKLAADWNHMAGVIAGLLGDRRDVIELEPGDYQTLLAALRRGQAGPALVKQVESWRLEPVSFRLDRLAAKARYMASRQSGREVSVHVDAGGLRLDAAAWSPFWTALVHAVSNAVDHGIESSGERQARGKSPAGNLWLQAAAHGDGVTITVRDDGRGVDWDRLRDKAEAAGLPHATRADLVAALFASGITTSMITSVTSGRGVGMSALRDATEALGGQIDIVSEPGQGTSVRFRFSRAGDDNRPRA